MTEEDEEFNRIEREAAMRKAAVKATVTKREWVGLTEEEKNQVAWSCGAMSADWLEFAEAIEAKLKEKNT